MVLVTVNRSVVDMVRVLAVGNVTTKLAVLVLVVMHVLVTVVVTRLNTVVTSSHCGRVKSKNITIRSQMVLKIIFRCVLRAIQGEERRR